MLLVLGSFLLILVVFSLALFASRSAPPGALDPTPPERGCLEYDSYFRLHTGEITTVDAKVVYGRCPRIEPDAEMQALDFEINDIEQELELAETEPERQRLTYQRELRIRDRDRLARLAVQELIVGGLARLELTAPLFPGEIKEISASDQLVDSSSDSASWAWEVRPDKPGYYELSLVLTILGHDGEELEVQNERVRIYLNVERDVSSSISEFFASIQGLIVGIVGLVTVVAGAVIALVRARNIVKGKTDERGDSDENKRQDSWQGEDYL